MLTAFAIVALTACDTDDLKDDINDLKGRVESLEAQVNLLNDNMTAIKRLIEGGQTITNVVEDNGTYTITLFDNSTITLTQGVKGSAKIPEIAVVDGYWMVEGVKVTDQSGNPVRAEGATGEAGATPKFQITEEGSYWQVSYNNGSTWENVLGKDGQPVSAISTEGGGGSDAFFESAGVDENREFFNITLKGGQSYSIPIATDLLCEIVEPDGGLKDGYWEIGFGETVTTTVIVKGDNVMVTAPAGWVATISEAEPTSNEATLTITAPANASAVQTRATADNSSDVTVQVNKGANWAVAKIKVKAVETSYYKVYQAGGNIEYNGIIINHAQYGDATLIDENTENKTINTAGVYFIKSGVDITFTGADAFDYLVLIGDNPSEKSKCTLTNDFINIAGDGTKGLFIMNMIVDTSALRNYVCRITGSISHIVLNHNEIIINQGRNLIECQDNNVKVTDNISVANNSIKYISTSDWVAARLLNFTQGLDCSSVTIDNNVIYPSSMDYTINGTFVCATGQTISSNITISHNTIINFISASQSLVRGKLTGNVTFSNLLFLYDSASSRNATLLNVESSTFDTLAFTDLIRYNKGSATINLNPFGGGTPSGQSNAAIPLAPVDPFNGGTFDITNGIFIPGADYAEYGASIN